LKRKKIVALPIGPPRKIGKTVTYSEFEYFHFLDFLDPKFQDFQVPDFQKSGLGPAWAWLGLGLGMGLGSGVPSLGPGLGLAWARAWARND